MEIPRFRSVLRTPGEEKQGMEKCTNKDESNKEEQNVKNKSVPVSLLNGVFISYKTTAFCSDVSYGHKRNYVLMSILPRFKNMYCI